MTQGDTIKGKILVEHEWPIPPVPRFLVLELHDSHSGAPYWTSDTVTDDLEKATAYAKRQVIPDGIAYRAVVIEVPR